MDLDKLSQLIIDSSKQDKVKGNLLSAELVVYKIRDNSLIRETVAIDFTEDDYQYQTVVKPIYME